MYVTGAHAFCSLSPQDLGLQATSLNHILYKNAAFLHLVDPISHELLLHLAKDMHCPKKVCIISTHRQMSFKSKGFICIKCRLEGLNIEYYKMGVGGRGGGEYRQYAQVSKHVYSTHNFGLGSFTEATSQSSLVHLYSARGV